MPAVIKRSLIILVLIWNVSCQNAEDNGPIDGGKNRPQKGDPSAGRSLDWDDVGDGPSWTKIMFRLIDDEGSLLLPATKDITSFCPKYTKLENPDKIHFWAQLFAAISRQESDNNRYSRRRIDGVDVVTGRSLWREGLLQVSYQDRSYNDCGFLNWESDSNFDPSSPEKSIFVPENNLRCGMRAMINHLKREDRIVIANKPYWESLNPKSSKLSKIMAITKALPFCKK